MTNAKKILITTESREIYIVRQTAKLVFRSFCEACAAETAMLTLGEAVNFTGKSTRQLLRRIETGALHSAETTTGHLLVCQNSLRNFL